MSKNVIIGLLVAAVVIGGGYLLLRNPNPPVANTTTQNPVSTTQNTTSNNSGPTLTIGAPKVETNQNTSVSTSTASVTGKVTPNGVPTVYWFEYGTTTPLASKTSNQSIGSGFSSLSAPGFITGLHTNTSYFFRLMAKNNLGTVSGATYKFTTDSTPAPKAAIPTVSTKSATSIARTSANVNGQVNPNGWDTDYWFEYGKDSNFGTNTSFTSIDQSTSLSSVSESISGLEPLTKYYFRLDAQNQFGTVNGSIQSFTTSGPLNPGAPTVTTTSASTITKDSARFNGRINPNGAETTYWFEYSEDSLLGNLIGSGTATATLDTGTSTITVHSDVSDLNNRTKYFYRLVARNQYGTVRGDIVSFTTKS